MRDGPGPRSVRVRLTLAVAALVAVVGGATAMWFVERVEASLVEDVEARNTAVLDQVTMAIAAGRPPEDVLVPVRADSSEQVAVFLPSPDLGAAGGTMIYVAGDAAGPLYGVASGPAKVGTGEPGLRVEIPSADVARASVPVSGPAGTGEILAFSPLDDVRNSVRALRTGLWFAVPLLAAAMGMLAWMVTGRALRPVEAIARRADEISTSNLHERVPEPRTGDEVDHLARTVNAMLARLEAGADRQRRFVSDASHELRSPVAAIRAQVEVAMRSPGSDWNAVGTIVLGESERLERLIDDLLALARASEAGAGAVGSVGGGAGPATDVRDVVTTEAGRHRRVPVRVEADRSATVSVPERDLERVVRHLLDNATRHARSAATISLDVVGPGDRVAVVVDDDGDGIPEDQRERVLERFTRLDEARSRDAGGAGLGLAVVDELVRSAGGTLTLGVAPAGGARVAVELPAATL